MRNPFRRAEATIPAEEPLSGPLPTAEAERLLGLIQSAEGKNALLMNAYWINTIPADLAPIALDVFIDAGNHYWAAKTAEELKDPRTADLYAKAGMLGDAYKHADPADTPFIESLILRLGSYDPKEAAKWARAQQMNDLSSILLLHSGDAYRAANTADDPLLTLAIKIDQASPRDAAEYAEKIGELEIARQTYLSIGGFACAAKVAAKQGDTPAALEYLGKHADQLEAAGKIGKAARAATLAEQFERAIALYAKAGDHKSAAQTAIDAGLPADQLILDYFSAAARNGSWEEAARFAESRDMPERAMQLYESGGHFRDAARMANSIARPDLAQTYETIDATLANYDAGAAISAKRFHRY